MCTSVIGTFIKKITYLSNVLPIFQAEIELMFFTEALTNK